MSFESDSYAEAKKQGAVLGWGNFVTVAINFMIIAWVCSWSSRAITLELPGITQRAPSFLNLTGIKCFRLS